MKITPHEIFTKNTLCRNVVHKYGYDLFKDESGFYISNSKVKYGPFSIVYLYDVYNIILGKNKEKCVLIYGPKVFSKFSIVDISTNIFSNKRALYVGVKRKLGDHLEFNVLNLSNMQYLHQALCWTTFDDIAEFEDDLLLVRSTTGKYTLYRKSKFGRSEILSCIVDYRMLAKGGLIVKLDARFGGGYRRIYSNGIISDHKIEGFSYDGSMIENDDHCVAPESDDAVAVKKVKLQVDELGLKGKPLVRVPHVKAVVCRKENVGQAKNGAAEPSREKGAYQGFVSEVNGIILQALKISTKEHVVDALNCLVGDRVRDLRGVYPTVDYLIEKYENSVTLRDLVDDAFFDKIDMKLESVEESRIFKLCREYMGRVVSDKYLLLLEIFKDKSIGKKVEGICSLLLQEHRQRFSFTNFQIESCLKEYIDKTIFEKLNKPENSLIVVDEVDCKESCEAISKYVFDGKIKCGLNDGFSLALFPDWKSQCLSHCNCCVIFCTDADIHESTTTMNDFRGYNLQLQNGFWTAKNVIDYKRNNTTWILMRVCEDEQQVYFYDHIKVVAYILESKSLLMNSLLRYL